LRPEKEKEMIAKPVKPTAHGIVDYALAGAHMAAPSLLGLNPNAVKLFAALGGGFLLLNGVTDTPVGIKKELPLEDHQKADAILLAGLTVLPFLNMIKTNRKTLYYTLGFMALAAANYFLTDYAYKYDRR
jgi:hypothetical protein